MPLQLRFTFLTLLALAVSACAPAAKPERVFTVHGVVRAPYSDGTISIQHEEIPNFMPAMTMPFYVDAGEVKDLTPGDRVEFEFRVGDRSRATKFRKLGRVATPGAGSAAPAGRPRLREGDPVPAFTLVDHDNRTMTEADLRDRHTIATFIFTRCPVPEFCPLITGKFQALQNGLAGRAESAGVRLLSISIDPENDRPPVLRAYGEAFGADFGRWRFATGEPQQVEALARAFAVRTESNAGTIDHTLATALIGPDGRVIEIWRGNAWKPEQILEKISIRPRD